jgi:carbon monoxide dehydrogenase subunit G
LKIGGSYTLPLERERAYALLQDPEVLARCMPGTDHLAKVGPDEYEMKMKMSLAAVQGVFEGKIRIADQKPPEQFRLLVEASGKIGFLKGDGLLTLAAANSSTELRYDGDVQVGGVIAAVGQRLLDTTAKIIIKKFFDQLASEAAQAQGPSA